MIPNRVEAHGGPKDERACLRPKKVPINPKQPQEGSEPAGGFTKARKELTVAGKGTQQWWKTPVIQPSTSGNIGITYKPP